MICRTSKTSQLVAGGWSADWCQFHCSKLQFKCSSLSSCCWHLTLNGCDPASAVEHQGAAFSHWHLQTQCLILGILLLLFICGTVMSVESCRVERWKKGSRVSLPNGSHFDLFQYYFYFETTGVFYYSFSKALSLLFTVLNILSNECVSSIIRFLPLYLPTLLASRCSYFCSITQEPHFFGYASGPGLFSSLFTGKKVKRTTTQRSF